MNTQVIIVYEGNISSKKIQSLLDRMKYHKMSSCRKHIIRLHRYKYTDKTINKMITKLLEEQKVILLTLDCQVEIDEQTIIDADFTMFDKYSRRIQDYILTTLHNNYIGLVNVDIERYLPLKEKQEVKLVKCSKINEKTFRQMFRATRTKEKAQSLLV